MRSASEWTEEAINKRLHGRFYQLQQKSLGTFTVVDLNESEDEPERKPPRVVPIVQAAKPKSDGSLWMGDITRVVCAVYDVTKLELESPRRARNLVNARQMFFWIAKRYTSHSYPFIGEWFGRDHTTVMHAVGKIDARPLEYREKINDCLSRLGVSLNQEAA